jgi:hypothetical protein
MYHGYGCELLCEVTTFFLGRSSIHLSLFLQMPVFTEMDKSFSLCMRNAFMDLIEEDWIECQI